MKKHIQRFLRAEIADLRALSVWPSLRSEDARLSILSSPKKERKSLRGFCIRFDAYGILLDVVDYVVVFFDEETQLESHGSNEKTAMRGKLVPDIRR